MNRKTKMKLAIGVCVAGILSMAFFASYNVYDSSKTLAKTVEEKQQSQLDTLSEIDEEMGWDIEIGDALVPE